MRSRPSGYLDTRDSGESGQMGKEKSETRATWRDIEKKR